jgi:hypothetical protein
VFGTFGSLLTGSCLINSELRKSGLLLLFEEEELFELFRISLSNCSAFAAISNMLFVSIVFC